MELNETQLNWTAGALAALHVALRQVQQFSSVPYVLLQPMQHVSAVQNITVCKNDNFVRFRLWVRLRFRVRASFSVMVRVSITICINSRILHDIIASFGSQTGT